MEFAEVFVDIKTLDISHPFDYIVPDEIKQSILPGSIVKVPFGRRTETGYVLRLKKTPKLDTSNIKEIEQLLSSAPVFDRKRLQLIFWMSAYYIQPFSKIAAFFLPPGNIAKVLKALGNIDLSANQFISKYSPVNPDYTIDDPDFILEIGDIINSRSFASYLFTGYGKKEKLSYMRALCSLALNAGKKAIIITPEISGAYRISDNLFYGNSLSTCINDYEMTEKEKIRNWTDIFNGFHDIILGSRSSLFLPFNNPGVIVIDDAHDPSYKESTLVRYNAQDVALKIAHIFKIPCIFFSMVPSVEMQYRFSNTRDFKIVNCEDRENLYNKTIIDLKKIDPLKEDMQISNQLFVSIKNELGKNNKVVIYYNKRGHSSFIVCKKCGNIPRCLSCNSAYRYHKKSKKLVCHNCAVSIDFIWKCPECGSEDILFRGEGIEKIEEKLNQRFKPSTILRIDSDTFKKKLEIEKIINELKKPGPAIIIGTQMVLKELGIKNIALAAVIEFESLTYLPDYSINDKAFQSLIELGALLDESPENNNIIIQAYNPDNFIIKSFISGNHADFFNKEITIRKELSYPPFTNLVNIIISGKNEQKIKRDISSLYNILENSNKNEYILLGPAQSPFYKINDFYRQHILVKTKKIMQFNIMLGKILSGFNRDKDSKLIVDVDPVWIL